MEPWIEGRDDVATDGVDREVDIRLFLITDVDVVPSDGC